jgi:hypothetical protein
MAGCLIDHITLLLDLLVWRTSGSRVNSQDRARDYVLPARTKHSRPLVSVSEVITVSLFPLRCATAILYHPGRPVSFP